MHELCQSGSTASFAFLSEEEERMLFLNHAKQTFEFAEAQTSGLVNLALSRKTGFFECEHPLIDKPMALTEPAVASARLLGLGSKLYPRLKMPQMLNKNLARFMHSLSQVRQNRASERKVLLAGWNYGSFVIIRIVHNVDLSQ